jgi:tRNA pseudouridine55 synthase
LTTRKSWRRVDGVLLLDKPTGMSSNSALQAARRLFSAAKAGHTGTLDPLASGLLPLCFGEATKFSVDLLDGRQDLRSRTSVRHQDRYRRRRRDRRPALPGRLRARRTRGRAAGFPGSDSPGAADVLGTQARRDDPSTNWRGRGSKSSARRARWSFTNCGCSIFRATAAALRVACSKGTYIRSLAEDLGAALACAAHLTALRRVTVGPLQVSDAVTLDQLAALAEDERAAWLLAPDALLQSLPAIYLEDDAGRRFSHGNPVGSDGGPGKCRVYAENRLLGLGEVDEAGRLQPRRVLAPGLFPG